jgi:beta-galactosidase
MSIPRPTAPFFAGIAFRSLGIAALGLALALPAGRAAARSEINLNAGWHFHFGETPGAETAAFNDAGWSTVDTPHTWNALDGQDGILKKTEGLALLKGDYARGSGWYRRVLQADPAWAGRQVYLQFDGANRRADVFLNGRLVGTHLGGNARFRFNVTGALLPGGDNLLAVRVNNEDNDIAPHSADFTFFGGLYRDVSLLVTDDVQVETMDYASPGVYLTQTRVSAEHADISARVKLANHEATPVAVDVHITLVDAAGKIVLSATAPAVLVAGGKGEVTIPLSLASPHLWNGRTDPYLYTARVEVSVAGAVRDGVEQPLGLRFYRVDPAQGFFLNGKYLDLHGVSRHQDRLDKGWAISAADDREDMALIAEMGCTAIRVAHYQQSPLWFQLADEQGIALWAEVPFVDEAVPSAVFFNNALDQMRELIRQNYNHPSIFFWGCGNENSDLGRPFIEGIAKYGSVSERQIQALNALAHAEDPSRLTTYASFHSEHDVNFALPGQAPVHYVGEPQRWYTDVTAFNKYYGWYYGEPEDSAEFFDSMHARNPTQSIGVSEYGAGGAVTQHDATSYGGPGYRRTAMESPRRAAFAQQHPEEYQAYYHEGSWKVFAARPYLWAKFVWNMFDFASDGRDEGDHPGRNDKGLVTFDRKIRKDAFYFYKANWSSDPVLHIASSRFTQRVAATTEVKIYANTPVVELFLNGRSLGAKPVDAMHIVRWAGVVLAPGENRVRATATSGLADECVWTLAPARPAP